MVAPLSTAELDAARELIAAAIREDLGMAGDRTTLALIPPDQVATVRFVVRPGGVVAGLPVAGLVLQSIDPKLNWNLAVRDGTFVGPMTLIGTVTGPLQSILIAERTALNFLQRMSGVATLTRQYVDAIEGTTAKVYDTRKTIPGYRLLDKYAVRCGGGSNHRIGLYDAILIKDNHIAGVGGDVREAVTRARLYEGNAGLAVEIEVDTLEQLKTVLETKPEIVLLDNMPASVLREAVAIRNQLSPTTQLEASGGVNLSTIRGMAETGVERISVGAITHSAMALDIGLDFSAEDVAPDGI